MDITSNLVQQLINIQFPEYSDLEIKPVENQGHDNRTYRLGDKLAVRLPSAKKYALQVEKENKWLPILSKKLKTKISKPKHLSVSSDLFPYPWLILEWIEGESLNNIESVNKNKLALDLSDFLNDLHKVDSKDGPIAGKHNFFRGGLLSVYNKETRDSIEILKDEFDTRKLIDIWGEAIESKWSYNNVWVHGDLEIGNLIINKHNELEAVIDFGILGVGDPACDLAMYYTYFDKESKHIFKSNLNVDVSVFTRTKGWVLWKSLITYISLRDSKFRDIIQQLSNE